MSDHRDIAAEAAPTPPERFTGRRVIATIGIDRYRDRHWRRLRNAVGDANGMRAVFRRLGFDEVGPPLFDDAATGEAINALVTDELLALSPDDSLVLFFAGHGTTRRQEVGGRWVTTGYLIPVDGENSRAATWVEVDSWLRSVAKLPPRHILVILDSCYSGIALSSVKLGRGAGHSSALPFMAASARPSRLVITSALDSETALDSGPVPGHSLFTGCLIQALTGGLAGINYRDGRVTTGAELAVHVRNRVQVHADAPGRSQTPDFGVFDYDERGEMLIPLCPAMAADQSGALSTAEPADDVSATALAPGTAASDTAPGPRVPAADLVSDDVSRRRSRTTFLMWAALAAMVSLTYLMFTGRKQPLAATSTDTRPHVEGDAEPEDPRAPRTDPAGGGAASRHDVEAVFDAGAARPRAAAAATPTAGAARQRPVEAARDAGIARWHAADTAHEGRTSSELRAAAASTADVKRVAVAAPASGVGATSRRSGGAAITACRARDGAAAASPGEPATAPECFVNLKTSPVGAEIVQSGEVVGHAPCLLTLPCNTDVELTFRKAPLYFDVTRSVRATVNGPRSTVNLKRAEHFMHVVSVPSGASIWVDGKPHGVTPVDIRFPAYKVSKVVVRKDGYAAASRDVDAVAQGDVHFDLTTAP